MRLTERPWLRQVEPYQPGRRAVASDGSMASNESAIGASPRVLEAVLTATGQVHRYPDPLADELRHELAKQHCVEPDQILVGNGSDELIYLLAWAFLAQTGTALCADPSYRIDEISTYVVGAKLIGVPLRDWTYDFGAMARVDADIAYLVNPHNPTGTTRTRHDIEDFVDHARAGLVVVDEAYVDFVDDPAMTTAIPLARAGRVVVLRTLSKAYGLAGLRIGYLVGPAKLVATLRRIRPPFSVGALAQAGALAAIRDLEHFATVRYKTQCYRAELVQIIEAAGYNSVPSQANFVLVQAPEEQALLTRLLDFGIYARPGSELGIPGTVRITVPSKRGLDLLQLALPQVRSPPCRR